MRKRLVIITFLLCTVLGLGYLYRGDLVVHSATAFSVGDLLIDWGVVPGAPIYQISNMAPGQSEIRTVKVRNTTSQTMLVGIRGVKSGETGHLAQALDITISQNGTTLYGTKSVQQFFDDAPMPATVGLSPLAGHADATYTITVTFRQSAGNEFQNQHLTFDLHISPNVQIPEVCKHIHFSGEAIFGSRKNGVINGTPGNDLIFSMGGNDVINGGNGDDCIVGSTGNEILNGGNGDDVIISGGGNDVLLGGAGNDKLYGGSHSIVNGGPAADACSGKVKQSCETSL
jgi:hypothetical protein